MRGILLWSRGAAVPRALSLYVVWSERNKHQDKKNETEALDTANDWAVNSLQVVRGALPVLFVQGVLHFFVREHST